MSRRLPILAAVLALGLGIAAVVAPGRFALGLDRSAVLVVGVLALLQAARVIQARRQAEFRRAVTPDAELPAAAPPPGADLHDALSAFTDARRLSRAPVRAGLRAAAGTVLARYEGLSAGDATRRLDRGTWTDDPYAAAFLGDTGLPFAGRIRTFLSRESPTERGVRRTVDAIADVAGLQPRTSGDGSATDPESHDFGTSGTPADGNEYPTGHWYGVGLLALVGVGVGILAERPGVVLAGVVGLGYAAHGRSTAVSPAALSLERSVGDDRPDPGDEVEVTARVTNEGDALLPDVRLVDGVPNGLGVTDGSPRRGTALRPGETVTLRYTVTARRGRHEFDPLVALLRNASGAGERGQRVTADATTLVCRPSLRALSAFPLRDRQTRYAGQVPTASGGTGLEFYGTRRYRPGDPLSRLDWNRRARTGEFGTLEFRQARAATVVVVVDVREAAYLAPAPGAENAVDRGIEAAGRVFATVLADGNQVGVAAYDDPTCWLPPGGGKPHLTRARRLFATAPAMNPAAGDGESRPYRWETRFRNRLPDDAQLILISPLCDRLSARTVRTLDADGYPVTVLSPDPTADATPGGRLARLARDIRLTDLRRAGIPVIDWPSTDRLATTLERHLEAHR